MGMTEGSVFSGSTPCTRAMTATYLWINGGSEEPGSEGTFDDVDASADYAKAVEWAVENGVTNGTSDTEFSPAAICSRGQIVTFLDRAFN